MILALKLPVARVGLPDDQFRLMRCWINECENTHPTCASKGDTFRPTRLLDLCKFGESRDLALVSTEDPTWESARYVTLSYYWGSDDGGRVNTTSSNIDERLRLIRFDELPLTFQDAVDITRKLDVRYLWIDSLCILQDSHDDWERQAAVFGQVFAHSYCTLAASSSSGHHGGCRVNADKSTQRDPFRYLDLELQSERIRIFGRHRPFRWGEQYHRGPLRRWAWALQERHLSRRVLHFSEDILLWECRTTTATEDLPCFSTKARSSWYRMLCNDKHEFSVGSCRSQELREDWVGIVEEYTIRFLTLETDKLPALSGLAQRSQNTGFRGQYFAGLWEADLPSALLWETVPQEEFGGPSKVPERRRPAKYLAPSWSWAAVGGPVHYWCQMVAFMEPAPKRDPSEVDFGDFKITETVVEATGTNPFGEVSGGHMCLTGRLKPAIFSSAVLINPAYLFDEYEDAGKELWGPSGETVGIIFVDVVDELQDKDEVFCLKVRNENPWGQSFPPDTYVHMCMDSDTYKFRYDMVIGLALIKAGEMENVYRRVGLVRWMKESWFNDVEASHLTIL